MNRSFRYLTGIVLSLSFTVAGYSQKSPSKFGKISPEHLSAEYCPIDSNAHAYYIFDYGFSYFQYATTSVREMDNSGTQKGFQLFFKRHFRIKILDNQGFDWANIKIPLYRDEDEEKIGLVKAVTYTLENGKVIKTKLGKKDVHTEETSKYWLQRKFAMPNVKAGSIIEVEYTIISDYMFNLREWAFQTTIPVLQSEYYAHIPEYYTYNQTHKGYFPIHTKESQKRKTISITYTGKPELNGNIDKHTSTTEYFDNTYHFSAKNIPAFPVEDYLRTYKNYLTMVEFELSKVDFPSSPIKSYNTTWEQVDKKLMNSASFGAALSKDKFLKEEALALKASGVDGLSLVNSAYSYIREKLAWNGDYTKYTSASLSKTFKDGGGNSSDVNLNLVALLRNLGFESYPVVLSTQKHGIIHPSHPSMSSFNYVIALVRMDDELYLMDATDQNALVNLLPVRCLNDKGRVIGTPDLEWISLMDYRPYHFTSNYALSLTDSMTITGSRKLYLKDYASYQYKKRIKSYDDLPEYKESLDEKYQDVVIENLQVEGLDSTDNALTINYDLTQTSYAEDAEDIVYFAPVFDPYVDSNPFKLEKREYPVEFNHPYTIQQNIFITLPEGYTVSELPKPMIIKMPDNSARYTFQVVESGNGLFVTTGLTINKSQFLPEEYESIKQFYQVIIDKQNELVVLDRS